MTSPVDTLERLSKTLSLRKGANPEESYTAKLFAKGEDAILKKIGEECAELIIASKGHTKSEIIYEAADVFYHILVLLEFNAIGINEVLQELERREGVSGVVEKNSRTAPK